jgi:hypothetical protein
MITTPDGSADAVVWGADAEYTSALKAYDVTTGDILFDSSVDAAPMAVVHRFVPPIVAKGHVFVPAVDTVYSYVVR